MNMQKAKGVVAWVGHSGLNKRHTPIKKPFPGGCRRRVEIKTGVRLQVVDAHADRDEPADDQNGTEVEVADGQDHIAGG